MNSGRRITTRDKLNVYDSISQQEALQNYLIDYSKQNQSNQGLADIKPTDNLLLANQVEPKYTQEEVEAKWYEKLGNMILDLGYDLAYGDVKAMEGLIDFFIGLNPNWKEQVERDLTAELFGEKYLGATQRKEARANASWATDINKATNNMASGTVQAVGQQLPRLAVALLTGGGSEAVATAGKAINTGMFAAGAFGGGLEEAYSEGANYGQALAYGALSAAIELGTEQISNVGSLADKTLFKGVLDDQLKKVTSNAVGRLLVGMVGEGFEEVASDFLSPIAKYYAYQKANGEDLDWTSLEELGQSFIVGALSAGVLEGGNIATSKISHGSYTVAMNENDIQEELRNLYNLTMKEQKIADRQYGFLTQEQIDKFNKDRNTIVKAIENKLSKIENRMGKMSTEKAEKVKNSFETVDKKGNVKKNIIMDSYDVENGKFNDTFKAEFSLNENPLIGKEGRTQYKSDKFKLVVDADAEITNKIKKNAVSGAKAFSILKSVTNSDTQIVFTDKLSKGENGRYDSKNKTLYVNVNSSMAIPVIVGHEFTHSLEGSKQYDVFKKYVIDQMKKDKKLLNQYYKELDKRKVSYEKKLGKELTEDYINDEILADFVGEKLVSNAEFLNELRNDKPKLFEKLKDLIGKLFGNNVKLSKEEREDLKKALKEFRKVLESEESENKEGVKYSLDSEGNELSKEQQEFFKDSKVRDENGNLKVVYHSSNSKFNTFDITKANLNDGKLQGFWFTDNKSKRYFYGDNSIEAYINITNPVNMDKITLSLDQVNDLLSVRKITINENTYKSLIKSEDLKNDYDLLLYLAPENSVEAYKDYLERVIYATGYDGYVLKNFAAEQTVYVVFSPEKIKNTSNLTPTSNPDIRYSLNFSEEDAEKAVLNISAYTNTRVINEKNFYDLDDTLGLHYATEQQFTYTNRKRNDTKLPTPEAFIQNVKAKGTLVESKVFDLGELREEFDTQMKEQMNNGIKTGIKYVKVRMADINKKIPTASFFRSNQTLTTTGKLKAELYKYTDASGKPKSTIIFTGDRGESYVANTYKPQADDNFFETNFEKKLDKNNPNVVGSESEKKRKSELAKKYDGTRTIENRELTDSFTEEDRKNYIKTKNIASDLVKKAEESPWESQINENETEKLVNIAPYYASTITDNDSYRRYAKNFDAALDKLEHIAKIHGCSFESKNSFGIYKNSADNFFQNEPSFVVSLGKVNMNVANYVASLFADAGFQQQEASISSRDVSSFEEWKNLDNKAIALDIRFDSTKIRPLEVAKLFQENEIDCTVTNGLVTTISFENIGSEQQINDIVQKYKNIYDILKERNAIYGKEFEKAFKERLIESNWLDEETRRKWYSSFDRTSNIQPDTRSGRDESIGRVENEVEKTKVKPGETNIEGENNIPATKTPGERRNSQWLETAKQSEEFKANFTPEMLTLLDREELSYEIMGNKDTVNRAKIQVEKTPLTKAYNDIIKKIDSGQTITQDDVAMAIVVAEKLAKQNRYNESVDLITTMSKKLTEYGRTIQAASLINRLTPEGKLKSFEKARVKIDEKNKKVKSTERENNRIKEDMKIKYLPADLNSVRDDNVNQFESTLKEDGKYSEEDIKKIIKEVSDYISQRQKITEYNILNILMKMGANPRRAKKMAADFTYKYNQDMIDVEKMYDRYDAVIIPRSLAKEYLKAKNNEERDKAGKKIQKALALQTKVSFYEKVQQFRYLSMLANPKTHIRNMASNYVMHQVSKVKDAIATVIEKSMNLKQGERANTFKKVSKEMNTYALEVGEQAHKAYAESLSKYNAIDPNVKVFKGRVLEKLRVLNNHLLENVEDKRAFKRAFAYKFGKWATANGYSIEFLKDTKNAEILEKGKQIALQEGLEQTYKDYSTLVASINQLKTKSKVADLLISTVMPFTKTPINIARRGIEYSPLGLAKRIAEINKVKSGQMSATTWVNKLSKNLTGTMITMLGLALAKMHLVSGADDDDKEGTYEKELGKKPFSIKIGGKYFTLDWLAPASIPFFTGVAIFDAVSQDYDAQDFEISEYFDIISSTLDPLTEMTFLSSLNSALKSYGNNTLVGVGSNMAKSYVSSFIPSVLSQTAKVFSSNTRRTTATTGDSKYFINSLKSKIPFLYDTLEPYIDVWGREDDKDNWVNKFMTNMVYPFWMYNDEETPVDTEILDLYKKYGNTDIIPKTPKYYYTKDGEKIELSSKDYTQFKKDYGTFSYNALDSLFKTSYYKSLSDEEKESAIKKVYNYALSYAKKDKIYTISKVLKLDSTKIATHLVYLSTLSTDETSSKKDKTLKYINSIKGISKPQKYLLMLYSGYTLKDDNTKRLVIKYVKSLLRLNNISKEEYNFIVDNYLS